MNGTINTEDMKVALPIVTASSVATSLGFVGTIRIGTGVFPRRGVVLKQFSLTFLGFACLSLFNLSQHRKSRAAFHRMMEATDKTVQFEFKSLGTHVISPEELDVATGVDGERVTRSLLNEALTR